MSVTVWEYYRPKSEGDQMFIGVEGVSKVTAPTQDAYIDPPLYYEDDNNIKINIASINIDTLIKLVNDAVYFLKKSQPCNVYIYAASVKNHQRLHLLIKQMIEEL
jgi:hypothetical protein